MREDSDSSETNEQTAQLMELRNRLASESQKRRDLEKFIEVIGVLLKLARASTDYKDYLDKVVLKIHEWTECECVGIRMLQHDGSVLHESFLGFSPEFWEAEGSLHSNSDGNIRAAALAGSLGRRDNQCITPGGSFHCDDVPAFLSGLPPEQRHVNPAACPHAGFNAIATIPLKDEDNIVGAIYLADCEAGKIPSHVVEMVEYLGIHIGETASKFSLRERLDRDIEIQLRSEMELQDRREELAHIYRVVSLGELQTSLAHEINQPLAAILTNANAVLRFLDRPPLDIIEIRSALDDIVKDVHRASSVIKRLRSMQRKVDSKKEECDIKAIITETVELLASAALRKKVSISCEVEDGLPSIIGDNIQLQQVLINLILNGFDALEHVAPDQRRLTVSAYPRGRNTIQVSVSDTGPGVDSEEIHRVFESFYTTKPDGMGMGLPISRSIIEAHRGRMWAVRNPDRGTTFSFTLPVENLHE